MSTTTTDPIPAREQTFAAWLRAALLAAIPADGTAITRNDARLTVGDRDDAPRDMTTGDVLRGMMRMVDAGEIEWCGVEGPTSVRRRAPIATTLDASRLRTIADQNDARLVRAVGRIRASLTEDMGPGSNVEAYHIAHSAQRLALAEAELLGYRAAVADLLGAVPA